MWPKRFRTCGSAIFRFNIIHPSAAACDHCRFDHLAVNSTPKMRLYLTTAGQTPSEADFDEGVHLFRRLVSALD